MKNKAAKIVMFLLGFCSLLINAKLFYNVAAFCDQYNSTPQVVYGGNLYLILFWINMFLLLFLCLYLLVKIIIKE